MFRAKLQAQQSHFSRMGYFQLNVLAVCIWFLRVSNSKPWETDSIAPSISSVQIFESTRLPDPRERAYRCDSMNDDESQFLQNWVESYAPRDTMELNITPMERLIRVAADIWVKKVDRGSFATAWAADHCPTLSESGEHAIFKHYLKFAYVTRFDPKPLFFTLKATTKFDDAFRKYHNLPERLYVQLTSSISLAWSAQEELLYSFPSDYGVLTSKIKPRGKWTQYHISGPEPTFI